jgi:hypothetical protein
MIGLPTLGRLPAPNRVIACAFVSPPMHFSGWHDSDLGREYCLVIEDFSMTAERDQANFTPWALLVRQTT